MCGQGNSPREGDQQPYETDSDTHHDTRVSPEESHRKNHFSTIRGNHGTMKRLFLPLLAVVLLLSVSSAEAQNCESFRTDCQGCLSSANTCYFVTGECSSSCPSQDGATCYSNKLFPTLSSIELCDLHVADSNLCLNQGDCTNCTSAVKSDGGPCQWYETANSCFGGGCGPFGCGSAQCSNTTTTTNGGNTPTTTTTGGPNGSTEAPTEAPVTTPSTTNPTSSSGVSIATEPLITSTVAPDQIDFNPNNYDKKSFSYYDDLRFSDRQTADPIINQKNHLGRNLYTLSGENANELLCHVPTFFRWTDGAGHDVSNDAFGGSAAAMLAMYHVNTGNSSIVADLKGLPDRCPLRFTTELVNTDSNGITAVKVLTRMITRDQNDLQAPQPCAILGASWSPITRKMATVSGVYDLLQITSSASSVTLDDAAEYPLFARTHPSDEGFAQLSVRYFKDVLKSDFVAVLFVNNEFGVVYNEQVVQFATAANMTIHSESIPLGPEEPDIRSALQKLQATGYNHIIGVFYPPDFQLIMEIAGDMGMAGPGKFWLHSGLLQEDLINDVIDVPSDSLAAKVAGGNGIIHDEGGLHGIPQFDKFIDAWKRYGDDAGALAHVNSKIPPAPANIGSFQKTSKYFYQTPSHISAFSYDAIVAIALSGCAAYENATREGTEFTGALHHEYFLKSNFLGASGEVVMAKGKLSRKSLSTYFVISDVLGTPNEAGNVTSFHGKTWMYYDIDTQKFIDYKYRTLKEFIYADGTGNVPQQIPDQVINYNYLSRGIRWTCIGLSVFSSSLALFFMGFTFYFSKNPVILASQPTFLIMICFGVLLIAASIIPFTMDDNVASFRACDVSCSLKFWMSTVGFCLVFSALFSKLWRINTVSVRRICPFGCFEGF